jgi:hypothetical protein
MTQIKQIYTDLNIFICEYLPDLRHQCANTIYP